MRPEDLPPGMVLPVGTAPTSAQQTAQLAAMIAQGLVGMAHNVAAQVMAAELLRADEFTDVDHQARGSEIAAQALQYAQGYVLACHQAEPSIEAFAQKIAGEAVRRKGSS